MKKETRQQCGQSRTYVGGELPVLYPGESVVISTEMLNEHGETDDKTVWAVKPVPGWRAAIKRWTFRWFGQGLSNE